jgi:hypothetical protein
MPGKIECENRRPVERVAREWQIEWECKDQRDKTLSVGRRNKKGASLDAPFLLLRCDYLDPPLPELPPPPVDPPEPDPLEPPELPELPERLPPLDPPLPDIPPPDPL